MPKGFVTNPSGGSIREAVTRRAGGDLRRYLIENLGRKSNRVICAELGCSRATLHGYKREYGIRAKVRIEYEVAAGAR